MSDQKIDLKALQVYLVEGTVEIDPIDNKITIRTVTPEGEPFSFDPLPVLASFAGTEIRLVITPLASVTIIEELNKKANAPEIEPIDRNSN